MAAEDVALKCRQTPSRANAIAGGNISKLSPILGQLRTIGVSVPKVEHAGCKCAILAADANMQQANDDIGIFLTPSAVVRIEAVNTIEIRPQNSEIARPSPAKPVGERAAKGQAADAAAPTID